MHLALIIAVAIGGAGGAVSRFLLSSLISSQGGGTFPWGTVVVNLTGSFLLAFVMGLSERLSLSPETRSLITVGFLGAFTTFSTLTYETLTLLREGDYLPALLYSGGQLVCGLVAAAAGFLTARIVWYALSGRI